MVSRRWLSWAQVPPELRSRICSRGAMIRMTLLGRQTDFACEFRGEALQPSPDTTESVERFSDSGWVFGASEFGGRSGLKVYRNRLRTNNFWAQHVPDLGSRASAPKVQNRKVI
jgi:hypothetical protein